MIELEKIAPGIQVVRHEGHVANAYIIGSLIFEPVAPSVKRAIEWIEWIKSNPGIEGLVVTHWHSDHTNGVECIAAETGVPFFAPDHPITRTRGATALGSTLKAWDVIPTPGHAPEHVCFFDGQTLIAGDMVSSGGALVFDEAAYLESFDRIACLGPTMILAGHGVETRRAISKHPDYINVKP